MMKEDIETETEPHSVNFHKMDPARQDEVEREEEQHHALSKGNVKESFETGEE